MDRKSYLDLFLGTPDDKAARKAGEAWIETLEPYDLLGCMCSLDYIKWEDYDNINLRPHKLPEDEMRLIILYMNFIRPLNPYEAATNANSMESVFMQDMRRDTLNKQRQLKATGKLCSFYEILGDRFSRSYVREHELAVTHGLYKVASTFVLSKRARLREGLLNQMRGLLCRFSLAVPEKHRQHSALISLLESNGYEERTTLSDYDRKAIERTAENCLDVLELSLLTGTYVSRQKYLAVGNGAILRDLLDEALVAFNYSFDCMRALWLTAFKEGNGATVGLNDSLQASAEISRCRFTKGSLKGTKFEEYGLGQEELPEPTVETLKSIFFGNNTNTK